MAFVMTSRQVLDDFWGPFHPLRACLTAFVTTSGQVLDDFWGPFHAAVAGMAEVRIAEVIDVLDAELGGHFFSDNTADRTADGEPLSAEVHSVPIHARNIHTNELIGTSTAMPVAPPSVAYNVRTQARANLRRTLG
eukprot:5617184-Pyramimonas_sp.AAC.2